MEYTKLHRNKLNPRRKNENPEFFLWENSRKESENSKTVADN